MEKTAKIESKPLPQGKITFAEFLAWADEDTRAEYESEGVSEYWLIDPLRKEAEFYQLGEDKLYHLTLPDAAGLYHSGTIAGFWLKLAWLWQDPLPDELSVLRELDILDEPEDLL